MACVKSSVPMNKRRKRIALSALPAESEAHSSEVGVGVDEVCSFDSRCGAECLWVR